MSTRLRFGWAKVSTLAHAFGSTPSGDSDTSACGREQRPASESDWDAFRVSRLTFCFDCECVVDILMAPQVTA